VDRREPTEELFHAVTALASCGEPSHPVGVGSTTQKT